MTVEPFKGVARWTDLVWSGIAPLASSRANIDGLSMCGQKKGRLRGLFISGAEISL
jgi:hypothetical protein